MLTRRQLLTRSLGLTTGVLISGVAAGLNHHYITADGFYRPVLADHLPSFETLTDMLAHLIVGDSPPPGRVVAGHRWLHRRSIARKFIRRYSIQHHSLPRGKHVLASIPSIQNFWIVDFDAHLQTLEHDITQGNYSDYPEWVKAEPG